MNKKCLQIRIVLYGIYIGGDDVDIKSTYTLTNGIKLPYLGFGVYELTDKAEGLAAMQSALDVGYRLFDTAAYYKNEQIVGEFLAQANVPRDHIMVTTKIWPRDYGYVSAKKAFLESAKKLGVSYIDMYLLHWAAEGYEETWRAMEELYHDGFIRAIGVCNFLPHHIEHLMESAHVRPMIDQLEIHPYWQPRDTYQYLQTQKIALQAWSPINRADKIMFAEPILTELAEKYHKTVAQIVLRWHLERHTLIIPKSAHPKRIAANADIFDFSLTPAEVASIATLHHENGFRRNPDELNWLQSL